MNLRKIAKRLIKFPIFSRFIIDQKYHVERKLLKGHDIRVVPSRSVIHFTFNKAASQYVKSLLILLAKDNSLRSVGLNDYAFYTSLPYLDHLGDAEMRRYQHLFRSEGFVYSAFGGMINGVDFKDYVLLLTTRDPRDILVSSYYSAAYSHEIPPEISPKRQELLERRARALSSTIDEHVIKESKKVFEKFSSYRIHLLEKYPQAKLLSYESMVSDFDAWINDLESASGYTFKRETKEKIIEHQRSQKTRENISDQRRKGVSGDYLKKLKPETIDFLNTQYEKELKAFGYL